MPCRAASPPASSAPTAIVHPPRQRLCQTPPPRAPNPPIFSTGNSFRLLRKLRGVPWIAEPALGIAAVDLAQHVFRQAQAVHGRIQFRNAESVGRREIRPIAQPSRVRLAAHLL